MWQALRHNIGGGVMQRVVGDKVEGARKFVPKRSGQRAAGRALHDAFYCQNP